MELAWIDAFLAVAETGSFSRAAESLYLSQSVVSKQVQKLEQQLEVPLFDRTRRQVALTAAGLRLLPEARALAEQYRRFVQAARPGGELTLALLPVADSYGLPRLLAGFAARHPQLRLQMEEQTNAAAHELLAADRCDGAIYRIAPGQPLPARHILLARDELVLLVPASMPLPDADRLELARFAKLPFLLLGSGTGLHAASKQLCAAAGFEPQVAYTGSSGRNIARMVRSGAGVALLAEQVARDLLADDLRMVRLTPTCESCLVFAPSRSGLQNPALTALRQYLEEAAAQP